MISGSTNYVRKERLVRSNYSRGAPLNDTYGRSLTVGTIAAAHLPGNLSLPYYLLTPLVFAKQTLNFLARRAVPLRPRRRQQRVVSAVEIGTVKWSEVAVST